MNRWLFQSNPERWRIFDYLRDHPDEDFQHWDWSAVRYIDEIMKEDSVAFWIAGRRDVRGVYAVGRITGPPEESTGWSEYAVDPEDRRRHDHMVPMLSTRCSLTTLFWRRTSRWTRDSPMLQSSKCLKLATRTSSRKMWSAIVERIP